MSIFPCSARVRRSSRNEAPPHIPEHCPFRVQTKHLHVILHTFIPSLPPSTCISHSCHHQISIVRHPIIPTLTFHMPKPPQSTPPHHLIDALYTQKTVLIHTAFPILQRHSAHPSHHHPFRPFQTLQIRVVLWYSLEIELLFSQWTFDFVVCGNSNTAKEVFRFWRLFLDPQLEGHPVTKNCSNTHKWTTALWWLVQY